MNCAVYFMAGRLYWIVDCLLILDCTILLMACADGDFWSIIFYFSSLGFRWITGILQLPSGLELMV